jgi:hypothetical protein
MRAHYLASFRDLAISSEHHLLREAHVNPCNRRRWLYRHRVRRANLAVSSQGRE